MLSCFPDWPTAPCGTRCPCWINAQPPGGQIDSNSVLEVLGLAGNLQTAQLMEHILRRDSKAALLLLHQLYTGGKDVGAVLGELSTLTRDLLLRRTAPEGGAALLSGGYDTATLDRLEQNASGNRLLYLASTLQKASADLYFSANRRMDAELCLLRLCDESLCGDLTALEARDSAPGGIRPHAARSCAAAPRPRPRQKPLLCGSPLHARPLLTIFLPGKIPPARSKPLPPDRRNLPLRKNRHCRKNPHCRKSPHCREEPPLPEEPGERVLDLPEPPLPEEPGERILDVPEASPCPSGQFRVRRQLVARTSESARAACLPCTGHFWTCVRGHGKTAS